MPNGLNPRRSWRTLRSMALCPNCNRELAPDDFLFPLGPPKDVKYCRCIGWTTLYPCASLSISNAQRLLRDGELLLKSAGPVLFDWFEQATRSPSWKVPNDEEAAAFSRTVEYPRLITAISLIVLAMQEIGKARLAMDYIKAKKDLDYQTDYRRKFLDHESRLNAAKDLMEKLEHWPDALKKRSGNLETIRQASLYVEYDYNFGLWLDPASLGSPEEEGSWYSGSVLTGLIEALSGRYDRENPDSLSKLSLGTERFNTFAFGFLLSFNLTRTANDLAEYFEKLMKDPELQERIGKSVRFRNYLRKPADMSEELWLKELLNRLEKITELISPGFGETIGKEVRDSFETDEDK